MEPARPARYPDSRGAMPVACSADCSSATTTSSAVGADGVADGVADAPGASEVGADDAEDDSAGDADGGASPVILVNSSDNACAWADRSFATAVSARAVASCGPSAPAASEASALSARARSSRAVRSASSGGGGVEPHAVAVTPSRVRPAAEYRNRRRLMFVKALGT